MIDDSHLNITPTKPADYICHFVSQGNIKSKDEENVPVILLTFHFDDNLIFHGEGRVGQRILKELQGQSVQSDCETGNCRRDNCQAFYKPILVRVCTNSRWNLKHEGFSSARS